MIEVLCFDVNARWPVAVPLLHCGAENHPFPAACTAALNTDEVPHIQLFLNIFLLDVPPLPPPLVPGSNWKQWQRWHLVCAAVFALQNSLFLPPLSETLFLHFLDLIRRTPAMFLNIAVVLRLFFFFSCHHDLSGSGLQRLITRGHVAQMCLFSLSRRLCACSVIWFLTYRIRYNFLYKKFYLVKTLTLRCSANTSRSSSICGSLLLAGSWRYNGRLRRVWFI